MDCLICQRLPAALTNSKQLQMAFLQSPSTDDVNITEISSDDSSDCIIVEQAPAPFQETEAHNKGVPGEARKPDEETKVKRVRFATPEHIPPTPPSEETSPAPPPPAPSSSTSGDDATLLTQK